MEEVRRFSISNLPSSGISANAREKATNTSLQEGGRLSVSNLKYVEHTYEEIDRKWQQKMQQKDGKKTSGCFIS
mgnify:FL=1